jgi:hypothetical protein
MGLTFAKSVKFGPLRFNFSGSGIGVSAGIPGLRLGVGPRGAYIAGGAYGFRYRQNLSMNGRRAGTSRVAGSPSFGGQGISGQPSITQNNISSTDKHDDLCVLQLTDCSDSAFLQTLNEQREKAPLWPVGAAVTAAMAWLLYLRTSTPSWVVTVLMSSAITATTWMYFRDQARRVTALFFQLDEKAAAAFEGLHDVAKRIASTRKLRSIEETADYRDPKYTAGATQGLKLNVASVSIGQAPLVASNIDVPLRSTGKTTVAFFPDRALMFQGKKIGAVEYSDLNLVVFDQKYIEHESVPPDARVIDRTWQYVNKKGGPDRRFKNNRELPVCLYHKLILSSSRGLDLRFMGSRQSTFDELPGALRAQSRRLQDCTDRPSQPSRERQ